MDPALSALFVNVPPVPIVNVPAVNRAEAAFTAEVTLSVPLTSSVPAPKSNVLVALFNVRVAPELIVTPEGAELTFNVTLCELRIVTPDPEGGTTPPCHVEPKFQLPVCADTNPRKVKLLALDAEHTGLLLTVITPVAPAPTVSVAEVPN